MFQEPVLAIVLKSSADALGLRLCVASGRHGAATRVVAQAGGAVEGDPVAKLRVEPGYQVHDTWAALGVVGLGSVGWVG